MTSRRERIPAGASNFGSSGKIETSRNLAYGHDDSSNKAPNFSNSLYSQSGYESGRIGTARGGIDTGRSDFSTGSILREIRDKTQAEKLAKELEETNLLKGKMNGFSRPIPSQVMPLRTVLLDPTVNNFPPSKTQKEFQQRVRARAQPHPSFDLDQDGYVSQEDYRLAKRFDLDGNGLLDPEERNIGKQVLADEFFREHAHELEKFGGQFKTRSHSENVQKLARSVCFERAYDKLKSVERTLKAESSKPIRECMELPDGERYKPLLRDTYYTDKFDCTAWNDFDAIPRSASQYGLNDHGGSRKRLLFTRQQSTKELTQSKIEFAASSKPLVDTRRVKLITDIKIENS